MWNYRNAFMVCFVMAVLLVTCSSTAQLVTPAPPPDRESLIPANQVKITLETDIYPVRSVTDEYNDPVPLPYPINTAGAEDSAFIMPDGNTLYVWFTPDPGKPAEQQLFDGVTGIYVFHKVNNGWSAAERVILQESGKLALDGCAFVQGDLMLFCTVREGYTGINWFSAEFANDQWWNWQLADFNPDYEVGELHITADGSELYFHSAQPGGLGGYDIWVSQNMNGEWGTPENVAIVNSPYSDGWPFVSPDGLELWFTRANGAPSLWRSLRVAGEWTEPQQMFSHFSAEASMDIYGNIYFTHHYFKDDVMLEADIYIASKTAP